MDDIPCTYRISVKALIRDDAGNILLVRENDGSWELPGGGLEHGEDLRTGLAREIKEELHFDIEWMDDRPAAFWTIRKDVGSPRLKWFAFVAYETKVSGEFDAALHANDEVQELRYCSVEEARALPLHANTKPYFTTA